MDEHSLSALVIPAPLYLAAQYLGENYPRLMVLRLFQFCSAIVAHLQFPGS